MSRRAGDLAVSAIVVVAMAAMVWAARDWPFRARLFPYSIGIVVLGLAVLQLANAVRSAMRPAAAAPVAAVAPAEVAEATEEELVALANVDAEEEAETLGSDSRRAFAMAGWLVAFYVVLVLFGFKVGSALLTLAFLRFAARESWRMTLAISLGSYLFFLVLLDWMLSVPFAPGLVAQWLGLSASLDSFIVDPIRQLLQGP